LGGPAGAGPPKPSRPAAQLGSGSSWGSSERLCALPARHLARGIHWTPRTGVDEVLQPARGRPRGLSLRRPASRTSDPLRV